MYETFPDKNPQNRGYELELRLYEKFKELGLFKVIKHEAELRKSYGWNAVSTDYLLELEDGIVLVQAKYAKTMRRSTKGVQNFLNSLKYLKSVYGKPYKLGLWISRLKPFEDNMEEMAKEGVYCISYNGSMEELVEKASTWIQERLGPK